MTLWQLLWPAPLFWILMTIIGLIAGRRIMGADWQRLVGDMSRPESCAFPVWFFRQMSIAMALVLGSFLLAAYQIGPVEDIGAFLSLKAFGLLWAPLAVVIAWFMAGWANYSYTQKDEHV